MYTLAWDSMREALSMLGFPSNPSCLRFSYNLLPTRKKVMILFYITANLFICYLLIRMLCCARKCQEKLWDFWESLRAFKAYWERKDPMWAVCTVALVVAILYWGRILGRNREKSLSWFPSCHSQLPLQLCLEISILQTHATSYSFRRREENLIENFTPFPLV